MQGGLYGALAPTLAGRIVRAMARDAMGNIIVAGDFLFAGNVSVNNIARWNVMTS